MRLVPTQKIDDPGTNLAIITSMRSILPTLLFSSLPALLGGCLLLVPPIPCGDGVEDANVGEECDDGNLIDADGCEADCTLPVCQNDVVDPGEVCQAGFGDANENPQVIELLDPPEALTVGDIDGDGADDLAILSGDLIALQLGDGAGGFAAGISVDIARDSLDLELVDVDRDGNLDLATVSNFDDIRIAVGDGNGGFDLNFIDVPTGNNPARLAFGDLDGDGDVDFITVNNDDISVVLNQGGLVFDAPVDLAFGNTPNEVALADLNGDGDLDLALSDEGATTVNVLFNLGAGVFDVLQVQLFEVGFAQNTVAAGDFNKDGALDLVVGLAQQAQVAVLFNDGGDLSDVQAFDTGLNPLSIAVADLDFDGDDDFATADNGADQLSVLINKAGDFEVRTLAGQTATTAVFSADFNSDGVFDLVNNLLDLEQVTVSVTFP
jgi:cysteine-rich repeat protein